MKMIIEIDEEMLKRISNTQSVPDMFGTDIVNSLNAIKNAEPYDDSGDLISRKYVEGKIEELENICQNAPENVLELLSDIKNAPPVNVQKIENKAYNEGFKDGVDQGIRLSSGSKDRTITDTDCMDEDAKQASIPYFYQTPKDYIKNKIDYLHHDSITKSDTKI